MSFKDLSLNITEEEYRTLPFLSYSKISKYLKVGFNGLSKIDEIDKSPELTFGSLVDCQLLTPQEFNNRFLVYDFPKLSDAMTKIVDSMVEDAKENNIKKINDEFILKWLNMNLYQTNWKDETRINKFKEIALDIVVKKIGENREIVNTETYSQALACCAKLESIKDEDSGKYYFSEDPFLDSGLNVEVYSQLKFKAKLKKREYKCMIDRIIIDNTHKTIKIVDLKTSGFKEWDFYKAFIKFNYALQARLYYRIVKEVIRNTEYADYKILPVEFVVINKESLIPLVWKCDFSMAGGELIFGKDEPVKFPDPEEVADELTYYLEEKPKTPIGINENGVNNLRMFLNLL